MTEHVRDLLMEAYAGEYRRQLAGLRQAFAQGEAMEYEEAYRQAHSLKGAARAVELAGSVALAHGLETLLQALWDGTVRLDEHLALAVFQALDAIEDESAALVAGRPPPSVAVALARLNQALAGCGLAASAALAEPEATPAQPATQQMRIATSHLDSMLDTVQNLLAELDQHLDSLHGLRRLLAPLHLDAVEAAWSAMDDFQWAAQRLGGQLAGDAARLRMVSVESVLGGFGPMLRRLAEEEGKEVEVVETGMEVMADREILQALHEPVLHLARNAVFHGLEAPEQRLAAGKGRRGRLELAAMSQSGRLVVRVADDGRGLDRAAIAAEAVQRGLPADADPADLIFTPGLTTAGTVGDVAGRGMGMAIVRHAVTRLQGDVGVESVAGRGTAFSLAVPVAGLSLMLVLVRVRGQVFALPAASVESFACVPADEVLRVEDRAVALVAGLETHLVELAAILGLSGSAAPDPHLCVVVLRSERGRLGLVVDQVPEVRQYPVTPLEPPLATDSRLSGSVTLGHGRLALVLSPSGLLLRAEGLAVSLPEAAPVRSHAPLVLVVDDSITTRTLERTILEAHGYRVAVAVDGLDALSQLQHIQPDAVISDIEMPGLDGVGLLKALKADPRLSRVPVVMVSSREAERDLCLRLGAAAYLVKTRFDQDLFLSMVAKVV